MEVVNNMKRVAKKYIAVLMGGWNSESEISTRSGNAVYDVLIELGYRAVKVNFDRNVAANLQNIKPDIVFNALHGQYGEDGRIQGLLDIMGIPYTHSGALSSAICMDKVIAKKICADIAIKIPKYYLLNKWDGLESQKEILKKIGKPFVIKPINEGSSVGVEIILADMEFNIAKYSWQYGDQVIVEKYIAGQEIQVCIVNDKAVGAIEVRPKHLFYDYKCKYTDGMTDYIMPAAISKEKYQEALDLALQCHNITGCKDISRVDIILNNKDQGDNQFYLLEINTHPGFTPTSLVPKAAKYRGISFSDIVESLIKSAKCE